jgi:hypothetical protein
MFYVLFFYSSLSWFSDAKNFHSILFLTASDTQSAVLTDREVGAFQN